MELKKELERNPEIALVTNHLKFPPVWNPNKKISNRKSNLMELRWGVFTLFIDWMCKNSDSRLIGFVASKEAESGSRWRPNTLSRIWMFDLNNIIFTFVNDVILTYTSHAVW